MFYVSRSICTLIATSSILISSCSKSNDSENYSGYKDAASSMAGLAFTAVTSDYSSSQLFYNDFTTGALSEVLTGESGDPALFWANDSLWHFNRSNGNLNFRHFDPRTSSIAIPQQIATPNASGGDPHAILALSGNRLLVAHYVASAVVLIDQTSGKLLQEIEADWDLGTGGKAFFHPELLFQTKKDGDEVIYLVHTGIDSTGLASDGSQQVFVLHDDGQKLVVVDQNSGKAKVQGLALKVSRPALVTTFDDSSVVISGVCNLGYGENCTAGAEWLEPSTGKSEMLFDFTGNDYQGNGGVIPGKSKQDVFALMAKNLASSSGNTQEFIVAHIDIAAESITPVFTFPEGSYGCCALYFDTSTETLYVGDKTNDQTGVMNILGSDGTGKAVLELPYPPYNAVFVPKP